jgi:DNA uptake protein ComE-like DNA-binding protein
MNFAPANTVHRLLLCLLMPALFAFCACSGDSNKNNPDEIRRRTAEATETMRQDTKAVIDGVKDGMGKGGTVNINRASREDLLRLPGLTDRDADRIIGDRPFASKEDLVNRRVVSEAEYDKIRDHIVADQ